MAFVLGDWSITRNGGALDVRYIGADHTGAATYSTTIELHRGLQALADDEVDAGDDELSIIDQTPSDRGGADTNISLINGCNIDDASSQFVYDGSITQAAGATIYDGIQVFGNSSNIQVIQNGARIIDDFWNYANMKTAVSDSLSSTTHRFLIKVRTGGSDIDGRRLLGTQRELGTGYTEFFIGGGTNRGNNVLALTANSDGNNQTAEGTIATWDDIVNDSEGYNPITIGGTAYNFYSDWELGTRTKNEFYERAKWIQTRVAGIGVDTPARDTDQALYGLPGDIFRGITHEIPIDTPTGTMVEPEALSWTETGVVSTGQLLAIDSTTAGTNMWIQLLSGIAPTDGTIITGSGTVTVNGTVTPRLVPSTFVGTSTGSAINPGAFGVGIGADDLTQNDLVVDLTNTPRTPPNNITFTVNNIFQDDYIIVANNNAGDFDFAQLLTNATYNTGAVTSFVTTTAIPTDIPTSGTFRIELDTGSYKRIAYTSFSGSTFTTAPVDMSGVNAAASGNNLFITYIDKVATAGDETATFVSTTYVFASPRTLFTRVRNAGTGANTAIKTFETTSVSGAAGGSATVGRIDDF
jgi:hypothetical protein